MSDDYNAVAFAADLIEMLEEEADDVQRPADGVVRLEVAFDRDGFAEWIIAALAEHGLAVLGDRDALREKIAEAVRAIKPDPYGVRKVPVVVDAVLDVLYGGHAPKLRGSGS